jgi:hypothetical protein
MKMACDQEILTLVSCYADGEAAPDEETQARAHLDGCAECRKLVSDWGEARQLAEWAYTFELKECLPLERQEQQMTAAVAAKRQRSHSGIGGRWRSVWAWTLLGVILLAVAAYRFAAVPPMLGSSLAAAGEAQNARMQGGIRLKLGPESKISRIGDRSIRLERGWVTASVRHGTGLRVLTPRLEVTDQGTLFQVRRGAKLDYVLVQQGSVVVTKGSFRRKVNAGQILLASDTGKPTMNRVSLTASTGDDSDGPPTVEFVQAALRLQAAPPLVVDYTLNLTTPSVLYAGVVHYVRTGEVLRIEQTIDSIHGTGRTVSAFDRTTGEGRRLETVPSSHTQGRVGHRMLSPLDCQDRVETALFKAYTGELVDIVVYGVISAQMEKIDGHDCWRVELPLSGAGGGHVPEGTAQTVWLDPTIGFCPRRYEVKWKMGKQPLIVNFKDYEEVAKGIWFQRKQTVEPGQGIRQDIVVHKIVSPNPPPRRENLLVRFAPGTQVYDERRGALTLAP